MGLQEKPAANSNPMLRVKMYCLNEDGKWEDQGTGHVAVNYLERSEDLGLFVINAEENETLLMHRIRSEDIYRKQEDSIISWRDPEYATELALSFQEPAGCSYIWEHIGNVQRNLQFSNLNSESFHSVQSDLRELPAVKLSTLPLIHKMVVESGIADQMRLTELVLHDQDFFRKLMEVFRICEDLDNVESLHMIFRIVKGIILLNSPQIFDKIFGDELIMDIIGSLEYDPEASQVQHHRNFLKEHVVFKEAIPIKDPTVLSKIHQTYRVSYLKDVVLTRVLDDATVASLNSIIHGNNAVVVSLLKDDSTFIEELFTKLRSPATSSDSKKNLVYFLHDFCNLSKSLQMVQQLRLFRDLMNEGIFDILKDTLQSQDNRLVLTGTDILLLFQSQDPNLLRSYVVRTEGTSLLGLLVKGLITDFGDDMHCQFLEILRSLLDSHTLSGGQRDNIVEIFYDKHLGQLIDVILASCPPGKWEASARARNQNTKPEILSNICELLCFCVVHHPYRTKCNLLLNNYIDKVLLLTSRREKYLVVAAIRFVRTVLSRHDEHLISHIIRNNLFKPIVDAFISNGHRYNLLNSAVLDLLEHIRKDNNLKSLLRYLVDSFWKDFVKFEYLISVQSLKVKFEQCQENPGPKSAVTVSDPRKRIEERALEKEEEDYFNEDSDEEDTASASAQRPQKIRAEPVLSNGVYPSSKNPRSGGGLVDYDDDEDDEDYRPPPPPPPRKQTEVEDDDDDGDEGTMASLNKLKRKLLPSSKDGGPAESAKKQRLMNKSPKPKEGVFAALCSTLSHAVLPGKRAASSPQSGDSKKSSPLEKTHQDKEEDSSSREAETPPERSRRTTNSSDEENHRSSKENENEKEEVTSSSSSSPRRSCSDNGQLGGGEDIQLVPRPKSPAAAEMAANGS